LLYNHLDSQSISFVFEPRTRQPYTLPQQYFKYIPNTPNKSVKLKFSAAAVLAVAAGAQAHSNVTYTTEVVTALTTYCPASTQITYGGTTYTVTEATTLTITNCPCTITKPVTTSTPYSFSNSTAVATKSASKVGTISASATKSAPTGVATAGAGKAAALSGAGLAGMLGVVAAFL
jgi:hypothetical protein